MRRRSLFHNFILLLFCLAASAFLLSCGEEKAPEIPEVDYSVSGTRDNTPRVMIPVQAGKPPEESELVRGGGPMGTLLGNEEVEVDISNISQGYVSIRYIGQYSRAKVRITSSDDKTYTYTLSTDRSWCVFPFSLGDGDYVLSVYGNIESTMYTEVFSTELSVFLDDVFGPFLYPNQYCWFATDSNAVAEGARVCNPANSDLDAVTNVFNFVVSNISYDWEEAEHIESGYLPQVDEVLETRKGICLDYSSLMASMLRTQGIPTRMEIGYAGTAYHAWISCYLKEIGWVNGIIQFDGKNWSMMDPTFTSTSNEKKDKKLKEFIGDGSNYKTIYMY